MNSNQNLQVAIIGAGPAGLFAAQRIAEAGYGVALFNRDIKPGGLVEYGIFPDKYKLRQGFRNQFQQILETEGVRYYGNVTLGRFGKLGISDLFDLGFSAVLVACGAQGTKSIGLPGEDLKGVFHAKDLVYHYNLLPPFSSREFPIGRRVAIIGGGNVMADIAHYLIAYRDVEEITAILRRGPAEAKFDQKELLPIIAHLDVEDFDSEIERVSSAMIEVGQDPVSAKRKILAALEKACPKENVSKLVFRFLHSPKMIHGDHEGRVTGLDLEQNILEKKQEIILAKPTGKIIRMDVDTVIFAIGDRVLDDLGLPIQGGAFAAASNPKYPVEGVSFEVGDPRSGMPLPGLFFAGWSRNPSTGLAGVARRDGVQAATALTKFLADVPSVSSVNVPDLESVLSGNGIRFITQDELCQVLAAEKKTAESGGLEEYKFKTNEQMLKLVKP